MTICPRTFSARGLVLPLVAAWAIADAADVPYAEEAIDDPEVRACLARMLPDASMRQKIRFSTFDRGDEIAVSSADLYWRRFEDGGSRALVRLTAPPRKAGLALLAQEKPDRTLQQDMTVYLPELRVVRRISGSALSGSMFGTNFSYDDFVQLQGMLHERTTQRLDDVDVNARPAYTIETVPQHSESQYSRILTYIDQAWCVAVQFHFHDREGKLVKEVLVDPESVREVSGRFVPHALVMTDFENDGRTELVVDRVEIDPELNPNLFTPSELRRGR